MSGWPKLRNPENERRFLPVLLKRGCQWFWAASILSTHALRRPVDRLAAWAIALIAADASSTAFMMLSDEEISDYCLANEGTAAIILPRWAATTPPTKR